MSASLATFNHSNEFKLFSFFSFIYFHFFITFLSAPRFRSSNLGLFLVGGLVTWRWIPLSMVPWYGPSLFPTLGAVISPVLYTPVRPFSPAVYYSWESSGDFSWTHCNSVLTSWTPPASGWSLCSPGTPPFTFSQVLAPSAPLCISVSWTHYIVQLEQSWKLK